MGTSSLQLSFCTSWYNTHHSFAWFELLGKQDKFPVRHTRAKDVIQLKYYHLQSPKNIQ